MLIANHDHIHDRHLKDSHELLELEHSLGKILLQHKSREFWDEDGQLQELKKGKNAGGQKRKKCGSSKKESLQEVEKGIIAGAQKLAIAE